MLYSYTLIYRSGINFLGVSTALQNHTIWIHNAVVIRAEWHTFKLEGAIVSTGWLHTYIVNYCKLYVKCTLGINSILKRLICRYRGTILVPFRVRGTVCNLFCVKTVLLYRWGTNTVPLGIPNYGQAKSAPRGPISVPFFMSDCLESELNLCFFMFL